MHLVGLTCMSVVSNIYRLNSAVIVFFGYRDRFTFKWPAGVLLQINVTALNQMGFFC